MCFLRTKAVRMPMEYVHVIFERLGHNTSPRQHENTKIRKLKNSLYHDIMRTSSQKFMEVRIQNQKHRNISSTVGGRWLQKIFPGAPPAAPENVGTTPHAHPCTLMLMARCTKVAGTTRVLAVAALGSLACLLQQSTPVCGMIHNLSVHKDARRVFQIESFGFRERGFMNLTVSSFSVRVCICWGRMGGTLHLSCVCLGWGTGDTHTRTHPHL